MGSSRSKYHSRKVVSKDGTFDSAKEYGRWCELKLLERAGQISNLQRQVRFELIPQQKTATRTERAVSYIADFVYWKNGDRVVEDTKGIRTKEYIIKRKLMLWKYGVQIIEI